MQLATKTVEAIDKAIEKDAGAAFRVALKKLLPKMEDAYRGEDNPFRSHLGISGIGDDCARKVQLRWLWCTVPKFPPRIHRLFNRGHLEEARFLSLLMLVEGVNLWFETEEGGQFRVSDFGGHYGSALDGIATGIPDIPEGKPAYTEFKTHNDKSFRELKTKGVRATKFDHYVQMQECMHYYNLPYGLYMAVNKNDDELYAEVIEYDHDTAVKYKDRAERIIFVCEPEPKLHNSPSFYKCKWCEQNGVCHGKNIPQINCRTCSHSTAERDGTWSCAIGGDAIKSKVSQRTGCQRHVFNPQLLPAWSFVGGGCDDGGELFAEYVTRAGKRIKQGPNDLTSAALLEKGYTRAESEF
ncbi:MAG: hypothetical protein Unbinned4162contig1001_12 [Prokaryotic dsDNA virus sp.]|nr:MAG: hypothetical protein Unbinned4162contig1001_12 [Prokaryotic dsDNA virus sp.]|tara:strand:+ start:20619 stop:21680 length:1062 start_codon:yes stop_codon:yes gene_type:complete